MRNGNTLSRDDDNIASWRSWKKDGGQVQNFW